MTKNLIIWILVIALSMVCKAKLFSQNDLDDSFIIKGYDAERYFVDEKSIQKYNIIHTNFLSYLAGDFHISYEFQLNPFISAEIGAGLVSNRNALGAFNEFINGIPKHDKPIQKFGFSFGLKYYLEEFPKDLYFNAKFRNRPYYGGNIYDLYMGTGYQKHYKNNIILGFGMAYGFRLIDYGFNGSEFNPSLIRIYPIEFSLGYLF